ncbi:hypothetical protein Q5P01_023367 [Channa striata]|uniref:Centrosomal protein of 55 kDa n=1 Tax=Channa striata TaxID=64152 RepID=A0AA88J664_CHASR|nr:hypothetical protein Q5P01_023367 [Channa striata]
MSNAAKHRPFGYFFRYQLIAVKAAMTSKGAKETIVSKLGFKSSSSSSKMEAELEKVRKENAHLKRRIDELTKQPVQPPDSDKGKVREVVASLQAQLEQRRKEAEQREMLLQNFSQETENLKNKLATVSARCQSLETQLTNGQPVPPADLAVVQDQLKDALEKNQQWLVYDQQREAYVQSLFARMMELEKQLPQTKQLQTNQEASSDVPIAAPASSAAPENEAQLKNQYEQLMSGLQKDLEGQKDQLIRTQQELKVQREQTFKAQAELQSQKERVTRLQEGVQCCRGETKVQLQGERLRNRHAGSEERKVSSERADRMRVELETMDLRLEEEKKRSAELLQQVNMLQKSLLNQNEEHRRIAALEQQIQLSAKDFENEKVDRHNMQHQLHKVLKELRKARDQIANLESAKQSNARFSEPSSYNKLEFDRLTIDDPASPSKVTNLLDESFLECPRCHAPYPTSRHRELLAHIDYCFA